MLEAMIFDLDGTLVQTEKLKALSYARAVQDLCRYNVEEEEILGAFKEVVGLPRQQVAQSLINKFELDGRASAFKTKYGVDTNWQAFVQLRLEHYEKLLADPDLIINHQWPHNLDVLKRARQEGCKTGLATMSRCPQTNRILDILNLKDDFDIIVTRDDVANGKPNPEIYLLAARILQVEPTACIVLEDSPSGIQAAIAAGMHCIAVTTPFTRDSVPALGILDERWIVHDPADVLNVISDKIRDMQN